jgi:lipoprotein-anchoring transpeptidase ErfK/SrfK
MKYIITKSQLAKLQEQKAWYKPSTWFDDEEEKPKVTDCSPEIIEAEDWKELYSELVEKGMIKQGEKLLIVWGPEQRMYYTQDGKTAIKTVIVSTGANGFNNRPDNKETPTGLLQVKGKVEAKPYEVIVAKTPTGKILGPDKDSMRVDEKGQRHVAEVLTGILELDGLEPCNKNAFSRNIYFHGTNKEKNLGTPRSNGCIRVSNNAIQWMLNSIPSGTKVYIKP